MDTNKGCNLHLKCSVDSQVFSLLMYVIENIFCSISLRVAGYVSLPNKTLKDFKFQVHLGSMCVLGPSASRVQVCHGSKCVWGPSVSRVQVCLGSKCISGPSASGVQLHLGSKLKWGPSVCEPIELPHLSHLGSK